MSAEDRYRTGLDLLVQRSDRLQQVQLLLVRRRIAQDLPILVALKDPTQLPATLGGLRKRDRNIISTPVVKEGHQWDLHTSKHLCGNGRLYVRLITSKEEMEQKDATLTTSSQLSQGSASTSFSRMPSHASASATVRLSDVPHHLQFQMFYQQFIVMTMIYQSLEQPSQCQPLSKK
ncbi:hypothetical protein OS493_031055 [Desmophyllum pertusum]|uniref:Uncharacterized protein n=1 Tax=Desmophyllum pertusum TaxID=174260 RepID=A0A9W9YWC3_9CNID|nr:hypothetical protein OS493_031055 [Desmophyllum pertusum]